MTRDQRIGLYILATAVAVFILTALFGYFTVP